MKKAYLESKRVTRNLSGENVTVLMYNVKDKATFEISHWKLAEQPDVEYLASMTTETIKGVAILTREPQNRTYSITYNDLMMFGTYTEQTESVEEQ